MEYVANTKDKYKFEYEIDDIYSNYHRNEHLTNFPHELNIYSGFHHFNSEKSDVVTFADENIFMKATSSFFDFFGKGLDRFGAFMSEFVSVPIYNLTRINMDLHYGGHLNFAQLWGARKIASASDNVKEILHGVVAKDSLTGSVLIDKDVRRQRIDDFIEMAGYDILEKHAKKMKRDPKFKKEVEFEVCHRKVLLREKRTYLEFKGDKPLDKEQCEAMFNEVKEITGQKVSWDFTLQKPYIMNLTEAQRFDLEMACLLNEGYKLEPIQNTKEFLESPEIKEILTYGNQELKDNCKNRILNASFKLTTIDKGHHPNWALSALMEKEINPLVKFISKSEKERISQLQDSLTPISLKPVDLFQQQVAIQTKDYQVKETTTNQKLQNNPEYTKALTTMQEIGEKLNNAKNFLEFSREETCKIWNQLTALKENKTLMDLNGKEFEHIRDKAGENLDSYIAHVGEKEWLMWQGHDEKQVDEWLASKETQTKVQTPEKEQKLEEKLEQKLVQTQEQTQIQKRGRGR